MTVAGVAYTLMRNWAVLVALVAGAGGCAHVDQIALGAATASTACDWGSTRQAAGDGWRLYYENNPMLGTEPSVGRVDQYFAGVTALTLAAWYLLPKRWRLPAMIAVTAVEVRIVRRNAPHTGFCGL